MKTRHIILASVAALTLAACSTDYLKPKPLSIYTPETTYTSYSAIRSAVLACNSNMNQVFGQYTTLLGWEMTHSDVSINGTTDNGTTHRDLDAQLTPSVMENSFYSNAYGGYWTNNYNGIKYANIILNRMQNVENWKDEAQENEIRGWGLFYRAYHYYKLVCQWGDVPWIGSEI